MGQTQEAEIQLEKKMQREILKNQNKGRKLPKDAKTSLNFSPDIPQSIDV